MIIVKLSGGLGNQMFQYAIGRKLSLKNKTILKLDISDYQRENNIRKYELGNFNIVENFATEKEIAGIHKFNLPVGIRRIDWEIQKWFPSLRRTFQEPRMTHFFPSVLRATKGSHLTGWWQSYKYFEDIREILVSDFTVKSFSEHGKKTDALVNSGKMSVSLHIRRGDYVNIPDIELCSSHYYQNAIQYLENKLGELELFVFSNDIKWSKQNINFRGPIQFITNNKDENAFEDLVLMSHCRHNIIANSTFSWWSAYLNQHREKIIIYPGNWYTDKNRNEQLKDLIPPGWIRMESK